MARISNYIHFKQYDAVGINVYLIIYLCHTLSFKVSSIMGRAKTISVFDITAAPRDWWEINETGYLIMKD